MDKLIKSDIFLLYMEYVGTMGIEVKIDINQVKVQLLWKCHKNLRHPPYGFDIYLVNVKTIRRMAQIFVAFSEKMNFTNNNASKLSTKEVSC